VQKALFMLARGEKAAATIIVGGKISESVDPMLGECRADYSGWLGYLLNTFGPTEHQADCVRYQLFHRGALAATV
jgi:hypothetical protein